MKCSCLEPSDVYPLLSTLLWDNLEDKANKQTAQATKVSAPESEFSGPRCHVEVARLVEYGWGSHTSCSHSFTSWRSMNQSAINQILCTGRFPSNSDQRLLLGNMTTHGTLAQIRLEVKGMHVLICDWLNQMNLRKVNLRNWRTSIFWTVIFGVRTGYAKL